MELLTQLTVDLVSNYPLTKVEAKQNDRGRGALVTLTASEELCSLSTNDSVKVFVKKADGTLVYNDCTVMGDGRIKVEFTSQALAVSGKQMVELEITTSDGARISTPIFELFVHKSNIDDSAIKSTNEFGDLEKWQQEKTKEIDETLEDIERRLQSGEFRGPQGPAGPVGEAAGFGEPTCSYTEDGGAASVSVEASGPNTAKIFRFLFKNLGGGGGGSVDVNNSQITFTQAATRDNIKSGETTSTIMSKLSKWLADFASGAVSPLIGATLTASRALISNASGKVAVSDVTATELGYLSGAKSKIQDQIGDLTKLGTTEKESLVGAINELNAKIKIVPFEEKPTADQVLAASQGITMLHTDGSETLKNEWGLSSNPTTTIVVFKITNYRNLILAISSSTKVLRYGYYHPTTGVTWSGPIS